MVRVSTWIPLVGVDINKAVRFLSLRNVALLFWLSLTGSLDIKFKIRIWEVVTDIKFGKYLQKKNSS